MDNQPRGYDNSIDKMVQEKMAQSASGALRGVAYDTMEPCRQSLRDSMESSFHRASRESRNAERMNELLHLLDKNPETARILDLMGLMPMKMSINAASNPLPAHRWGRIFALSWFRLARCRCQTLLTQDKNIWHQKR